MTNLSQLLLQAAQARQAFLTLTTTNHAPVPLAQVLAAQQQIAQTHAAVRAAVR